MSLQIIALCLHCDACNFGGSIRSLGRSDILEVAKFDFSNNTRKIGPITRSKHLSVEGEKAYQDWKNKRGSKRMTWEGEACQKRHPTVRAENFVDPNPPPPVDPEY